jgi:hypothetical protein
MEHVTVIIPSMEGVTAAIVGFIFLGVAIPRLIKNKTQFYAGFVALLLIILLQTLNVMIHTAGFQVFGGALTGLLQLIAVVMLFMSAGGLSPEELGGEIKNAFEVIRRGEDKPIIVPLTGERPKPREERMSSTIEPEAPAAQEQVDLPPDAGWPTKKSPDQPTIPLEE